MLTDVASQKGEKRNALTRKYLLNSMYEGWCLIYIVGTCFCLLFLFLTYSAIVRKRFLSSRTLKKHPVMKIDILLK